MTSILCGRAGSGISERGGISEHCQYISSRCWLDMNKLCQAELPVVRDCFVTRDCSVTHRYYGPISYPLILLF